MKILDELINELTVIQDRERQVRLATEEILNAFRMLERGSITGNDYLAIKSSLNQALLYLERA